MSGSKWEPLYDFIKAKNSAEGSKAYLTRDDIVRWLEAEWERLPPEILDIPISDMLEKAEEFTYTLRNESESEEEYLERNFSRNKHYLPKVKIWDFVATNGALESPKPQNPSTLQDSTLFLTGSYYSLSWLPFIAPGMSSEITPKLPKNPKFWKLWAQKKRQLLGVLKENVFGWRIQIRENFRGKQWNGNRGRRKKFNRPNELDYEGFFISPQGIFLLSISQLETFGSMKNFEAIKKVETMSNKEVYEKKILSQEEIALMSEIEMDQKYMKYNVSTLIANRLESSQLKRSNSNSVLFHGQDVALSGSLSIPLKKQRWPIHIVSRPPKELRKKAKKNSHLKMEIPPSGKPWLGESDGGQPLTEDLESIQKITKHKLRKNVRPKEKPQTGAWVIAKKLLQAPQSISRQDPTPEVTYDHPLPKILQNGPILPQLPPQVAPSPLPLLFDRETNLGISFSTFRRRRLNQDVKVSGNKGENEGRISGAHEGRVWRPKGTWGGPMGGCKGGGWNHGYQWKSFMQGWNSIGNVWDSVGISLVEAFHSPWAPLWSAYISHSAPLANHHHHAQVAIQKVLDLRFHPMGRPYLVCGCNEGPNELMLFHLDTGKAVPLVDQEIQSQSTQIQSVEFACGGHMEDLLVSCVGNIIKVWSVDTATCKYTLGGEAEDRGGNGGLTRAIIGDGNERVTRGNRELNGGIGTEDHPILLDDEEIEEDWGMSGEEEVGEGLGVRVQGHIDKVSSFAVNPTHPSMICSSGADKRLLLWDISKGTLKSHLNASIMSSEGEIVPPRRHPVPKVECVAFGHHDTLLAGSDDLWVDSPSRYCLGVLQQWDLETAVLARELSLHTQFISCLNVHSHHNLVASGSGDGTIALVDLRQPCQLASLPMAVESEINSVSFSSCGTYLQGSCTANCTFIWDLRSFSPWQRGQSPQRPSPCPGPPLPCPDALERGRRALFCLSQGRPMPSTPHAGLMPGVVDVGDQGINDARWMSDSPTLVTGSGNGSVALWDVRLGEPCVKMLSSHTRSVNAVAIAPDDSMFASGGDDQKVVLYQSRNINSKGWRLVHSLRE